MPTLFLVRHAEPALTNVVLGCADAPLSDAGRVHAASIWGARELPRRVYSSPLLRARQTAELMTPMPVEIVDDFREISYGAWDGKTWDEIESVDPEVARRKQADWFGVTPPGGESWADFDARIIRAWERIRNAPAPCAIVAHAAVNAVLAAIVAEADPLAFRQQYGEVLAFEF